MKRVGAKASGLVGLLVIAVVVIAVLPWLRRTFAPVFPEGFQADAPRLATLPSRELSCQGVTCKEGEFCADNTCRPRYVGASSDPTGYATGMSAVTNYASGGDDRKVDCLGVTCAEGEFCENNVCRPRYVGASGEPVGYMA